MLNKIKREYVKLIGIVIIVMMNISSNDTHIGKIFPSLDLMFIYYWCLFKPKTTGSIYVFSIGLFKDILMGFPIGLNASIFIIIRLFIKYRVTRLRDSFLFFWQGFAILLFVSLFFKWVIFSIITTNAIDLDVIFQNFILSLLTYPLIHGLFNQIFSIIPGSQQNA